MAKKKNKNSLEKNINYFSIIGGFVIVIFSFFAVFESGISALFSTSSNGRMGGIPLFLFLILGLALIYYPLKQLNKKDRNDD